MLTSIQTLGVIIAALVSAYAVAASDIAVYSLSAPDNATTRQRGATLLAGA